MTHSAPPARPAYPIESVGNALRLLLMLRSRDELRISECAREIGVARSTAHRLLTMLEHYEFLSRNPSGRGYRSGPALIGLGMAAVGVLGIRDRARPHLEALRDELDETVSLVLVDGATARFVDAAESGRPLRVAGRVGLELPAHRTSAGVAVIAAMDDAQRAERVAGRAGLERSVAEARERGYAVVHNESDIEIAAVGVAVPGALAGLAVAAPAGRATAEAVTRWAAAANAAARRIALG
ncbi:hypothetical protein GCM10009613_20470 [Pseudonocardia kongjuensis]|uniref:IclR family transcriptional regulator n=1 Tax=Pseudonocardia kongjuensis TaxID=102227 RepID=A0ABN1XNV6_9PSEU